MNNARFKTFFSLTAACLLAGIGIAQAGTRGKIATPPSTPIMKTTCEYAGPGVTPYHWWNCKTCEFSEFLQMNFCSKSWVAISKTDPSDP